MVVLNTSHIFVSVWMGLFCFIKIQSYCIPIFMTLFFSEFQFIYHCSFSIYMWWSFPIPSSNVASNTHGLSSVFDRNNEIQFFLFPPYFGLRLDPKIVDFLSSVCTIFFQQYLSYSHMARQIPSTLFYFSHLLMTSYELPYCSIRYYFLGRYWIQFFSRLEH